MSSRSYARKSVAAHSTGEVHGTQPRNRVRRAAFRPEKHCGDPGLAGVFSCVPVGA